MHQFSRDPANYNEASCDFIYPDDEKINDDEPEFIRASDAILRVLLLIAGSPSDSGYKIQALVFTWLIERNQSIEDFSKREGLPIEKIIETLKSISRHKDILSLRAACILRLISKEGRRLEDIGKQYGVTRAFVNKEYRILQNKLQIRARADKPEPAREKFRQICIKRGSRKLTTQSKAWKSFQIP